MVIYLSKVFIKKYRRLPNKIKSKLEKLEKDFRTNPFDPKLKTHPLVGKLKGYYAFSIDYQYRIIFTFKNENEVWFHNIGTHQIYK